MEGFVKNLDNLTVSDICTGNTELMNVERIHEVDQHISEVYRRLIELQAPLDVILSPVILATLEVCPNKL
jgi:hypothetical protein